MRHLLATLAAVFAGCGQPCDVTSVCDAVVDGLEARAGDCGITILASCPYTLPDLTVCDIA
jgi:hypothetical protein